MIKLKVLQGLPSSATQVSAAAMVPTDRQDSSNLCCAEACFAMTSFLRSAVGPARQQGLSRIECRCLGTCCRGQSLRRKRLPRTQLGKRWRLQCNQNRVATSGAGRTVPPLRCSSHHQRRSERQSPGTGGHWPGCGRKAEAGAGHGTRLV